MEFMDWNFSQWLTFRCRLGLHNFFSILGLVQDGVRLSRPISRFWLFCPKLVSFGYKSGCKVKLFVCFIILPDNVKFWLKISGSSIVVKVIDKHQPKIWIKLEAQPERCCHLEKILISKIVIWIHVFSPILFPSGIKKQNSKIPFQCVLMSI